MNEIVKKASDAQALASDPTASAFVSANAGTGKTKLLTDRVLRLLLEGAVADGILCVTYTRAAAAEMRNRIANRLAQWAIIPTVDLRSDLAGMGLPSPSQEVIARARRLFAEILDNDHGPRVETVHSFCQSILGRFPIEAGIAPRTGLADDAEQDTLRAAARVNVMRSNDKGTTHAVMLLAEQINEDQLQTVLTNFVQRETRLEEPDLEERLTAHFRDGLGLADADHADRITREAIARFDEEGLIATATVLQASGVSSHQKRAAKMHSWLANDSDGRCERIDLLVEALFTDGNPRSVLANRKIRDDFPRCEDVQREIQEMLLPCMLSRAEQRCREITMALYHFGMAFQREYSALKRARGLLDYDDLITITNNLMDHSSAAQWVAWKLDNGIRHLLIDEAQDTSPSQWKLLRQLSLQFFDDQPDANPDELDRSLFAVGDFKQSIYSFQGADPRVMNASRSEFSNRAEQRERTFRQVSLSVSFRSSVPVLQLVNAAIDGLEGIEDFTPHEVTDSRRGGFVELLPHVEVDDASPATGPFVPSEIVSATGASAKSANQIATMIKGWIGIRKLADGRTMAARDIMILLRKRGSYFEQLLAALRRTGVAVAGADRMRLENQIEIQDLLALGDVITLPDDDLQLASVLKSPLFGMDEDQLFGLAHDRGDKSLYAALMQHAGADSQLGKMADHCEELRKAADQMSLFAFFSHVIDKGGRAAFRERLGASVDEALDHFLAMAQSFGHAGGASMIEFLMSVRATGGEIKRDLDNEKIDAVRVMTIHGAKGLESPVVVLPDMLRATPPNDPLFRDAETGFVYWSPDTAFRPNFLNAAREDAKRHGEQEGKRLLYVALTRAREGLVIAGWSKPRARALEGSDYEILRACLRGMEGVNEENDGTLALRHQGRSDAKAKVETLPPETIRQFDAPQWLFSAAPSEPKMPRPVRPSEPAFDQLAPRPAAATLSSGAALAKGRLAHRLFEILPALDSGARESAARKIIRLHKDIGRQDAELVFQEVMTVLAQPTLSRLFAPDALAEVPVNGVVADVGVAGQIDRLHVDNTSVLFADLKTGQRPSGPPPLAYQRQMALYGALLQQIYPDHRIKGWIIWTEDASTQEVTKKMCADSLAEFGDFS